MSIALIIGCSEMLMANAVAEEAAVTAGKEARAMESFANALRNMPAIIAENGGYDSAQLVSELKALHKQGNKTAGLGIYLLNLLLKHFRIRIDFFIIFVVFNLFAFPYLDMYKGCVGDMVELGITESLSVKRQVS